MSGAASWARALVATMLAALVGLWLPRVWAGRGAEDWMAPAPAPAVGLALTVAERAGVRPTELHTGSALFDGEWALVQNQMTVLGLAQVLREQPALAPRLLPAMRRAAAAMLTEEALAFGARQWPRSGDPMLGEEGRAYLGYAALALGALRRVDPDMPAALVAQHEALVQALAARIEASPHGLIETYPGVTFPADVASVIGAIGAYDRATGSDHGALIARWSGLVRERYRGPDGLVVQTADPVRGVGTSAARASGTAILIYFVRYADPALARELDSALAGRQRSFLGFGGLREYPDGVFGQSGDADSGPVLFGVSVSATGFGLAGARMQGDVERFRLNYRTATLFGAPVRRGEGWGYVSGSGLGDAILLAMMTAEPL